MDKIQLNKYIKSITDQIPVVNSFYTDDVYEVWNGEEIRYGSLCFCITSSSISDNTTTWNGLLYYGDRLLDDKSNRDSVQSDANNVINAIMNVIAQDEDIVAINYPTAVTFFEQKFADYLAGGYADIQIETDNSISKCGYGFVKEQEGCAGKIAELEDEIEVLEEKNDRLSDLLDNANETLELAERNLMSCRKANEVLTESNQQLETENDRLESEVERLEESISILPDYASIGYNLENAGALFETEYEAINVAKGDFIEPNSSLKESTVLYYPPTWDQTFSSVNFRSNTYVRYIPDCPTLKNNAVGSGLLYDMFTACYNLIGVGRIKTNSTSVDLTSTFSSCYNLRKSPIFELPKDAVITKINQLFMTCYRLNDISTVSDFNVSSVTTMDNTFSNCRSLTDLSSLAKWNVGKVTSMKSTFSGCRSLTNLNGLENWDTSSLTAMNTLFFGCHNLTDISALANWDVSNVTSFGPTATYGYEAVFTQCRSLTNLSGLEKWKTSKVSNMSYTFYNCRSLTDLSALANWDVSSVTTFKEVFGYCRSLTNLNGLENWDTSSLTSLDGAFRNCASLTDASAIGDWNTSNVTVMASLFYDCTKLHKLPLIDCSSVSTIGSFFGYSNINNLTDVGGFTGLKLNFDGLSKCPNLTVQSLLNVFNTIADVNGLGTKTLTIGTTNLSKLTDDQKAIATAKGWTLK